MDANLDLRTFLTTSFFLRDFTLREMIKIKFLSLFLVLCLLENCASGSIYIYGEKWLERSRSSGPSGTTTGEATLSDRCPPTDRTNTMIGEHVQGHSLSSAG